MMMAVGVPAGLQLEKLSVGKGGEKYAYAPQHCGFKSSLGFCFCNHSFSGGDDSGKEGYQARQQVLKLSHLPTSLLLGAGAFASAPWKNKLRRK